MGKLIKIARTQILVNVRRVAFEGIMLTFFLSVALLFIITNTYRAIQNGKSNYNIYQSEQKSLTDIQSKNEELINELSIVNSDEYQKLLAREVLGIAEPGESLYKIEENRVFYEVEKKYAKVEEVDSYTDWWLQLVGL